MPEYDVIIERLEDIERAVADALARTRYAAQRSELGYHADTLNDLERAERALREVDPLIDIAEMVAEAAEDERTADDEDDADA